jgi:hypothetical protein
MRIEKENPKFNGPMLSACNALAPGPQLRDSGNVNPPQADFLQSWEFR